MDPYIGEIRLFAGNFAPRGWALCDGSVLHISQYSALFSVIGNVYGGDGKTTFALPNLLGKAAIGQGSGPGLTTRQLGISVGQESVTLTTAQMPSHTHIPNGTSVSSGATATADPTNAIWGSESAAARLVPYSDTPTTVMHPSAVSPSGLSTPHNNMQPYLALTFIIATEGVFPPKS